MLLTEVITFCHELDMLEAHLEEHKNFVDRTIIRESKITYSCVEKPLYFKENESRFSRYNITYEEVPVDYFNKIPFSYPAEEHKKWFNLRRDNRERSKRWKWDEARKGAGYVMVMDTDEIIAESKFDLLKREALNGTAIHVLLRLMGLSYFVNGRCSKKEEYRIVRGDQLTHYRERGTVRGGTSELVGWHFSNCFKAPEDHWLKMTGLCHSLGKSVAQVPSVREIKKSMDNLIEPALKKKMNWAEILSTTDLSYLPKFMQAHPEKFPFYTWPKFNSNSGLGEIDSQFFIPEPWRK